MTPLYTMDQVAARYGKSRRAFQDWLRGHQPPAGQPHYYRLMGRSKLFTDADLARLDEAIRCPSPLSRRKQAGRRISTFAARTSASELTEALRLTTEKSPRRCSPRSSARSNVVS